MMIIGLTGGIGSGKSTVAKMFKDRGVPVFEADSAGKEILQTHKKAKDEIKQLLGKMAYDENDHPNRQWIGEQVFKDKDLLKKLNRIIHPKVHNYFERWKKKQKAFYIIYEAAIIFEEGREKNFDRVVLVVADKSEKIKRVVQRDQTTSAEVENRMKNQWPDNLKKKKADFIIRNRTLERTQKQVNHLHNTLDKEAKNQKHPP